MGNIENIYVIGDVHGCFYTLQKLLDKLPYDAQLLFVGDLCDKGKYSKDVIEFVRSKGHSCLKGNHEYLMEVYALDAIYNGIESPWSTDKRYGGVMTLDSYQDNQELLKEHIEWIKTLPIYIEIDKYFITHGFGLPHYENKNDKSYRKNFLLDRYEIGMEVENGMVTNIFGHCVFDEVVSGKNFYAIDTGCAYGKKLTALQLGTMKTFQEPMDERDSNYSIKELKLDHISLPKDEHTLENLRMHIDMIFTDFDLVSTEVAHYVVQKFGEEGKKEIEYMLEKKQLFIKQAKRVIQDNKINEL